MWIFAVPFSLRRIKIIIGSMFLISLSFPLWIRVSVIAEPTTNFPFHSLCCDSHQLLSEDQKCVGLVLGSANPLEELNTYTSELVMDPLFQCNVDAGSKLLYFTTGDISLKNGTIVEPFSNQTLLKGDYCVQPSTQMGLTAVLFCRRPAVQIRKCCPLGQLINRTSIDQCVVGNKDEPPSQLPVTHFVESTAAAANYGADDIVVQGNASLQCDFDYNIYLPGYFIDHGFKVSQEWGLYVKKAAYGPIRHSKNYCVDSTVLANGTEGLLRDALASEQRLLDFQLDFSCTFTRHLPGPLAAGLIEGEHPDLLHAQLLRLSDCHALPKRHLFALEIRAAYLVLKQRCELKVVILLPYYILNLMLFGLGKYSLHQRLFSLRFIHMDHSDGIQHFPAVKDNTGIISKDEDWDAKPQTATNNGGRLASRKQNVEMKTYTRGQDK
ncbi:hypothetical protein DAPPUDRAFT_94697 [Daphnia pulex]|uniref:Uncharacterized protein n=1 Tax=Daphnia pulex TaxID=6669 RepID=E9FST1_DAPPU|nr:hypothetical protein DAPPUDRAFT_94697 [Daphnia pulex]|eukprot:EFX89768.1 hypothetical protein DAPPUDRAFT_94697 [Daphnia pulex]